MRGATQCARRLKLLIRALRTKLGKVSRPTTGDPIKQMILGVLSRDVPESKALEALGRLRALVVDYNELRVVPPIEMTEMIGDLPHARLKCEDLSRALNKVFANEHEVLLDRLSTLSRKDVIAYLEAIDGLDPYSRARIRLLGLQQHAIPLNEAMWAYARKAQIVDRKCPLVEAQAFLERRVPEEEALEFFSLVEKQAWIEAGTAVRSGEVERITSVPPDRTARNMLQLVASGRGTAGVTAAAENTGNAESRAKPAATGPWIGTAGGATKAEPARRTRARKSRSAASRRGAKRSTNGKRKTRPKRAAGTRRRRAGSGRSPAKKSARTRVAKRAGRSSAKAKSA